MENVHVTTLNPSIESAFYALAAEYLPGSDPGDMRRFAQMYPQAFLALLLDGHLIAVAFGWPSRHFRPDDPSFELNGIAVTDRYWRKSYGRTLLKAFEEAARTYDAACVSVGSAGGYVESFYIDCGYFPKEYKIWSEDRCIVEHTYADLEDYVNYQRKNTDGFVVMEKTL